ncbi:hypothetical protein H2201_005951 [Coniosporium apollinis]|uniref:Uncharacterized protein n=1 Tax=Coniosporium apollinis TaxID=61459 RepID=A0ABQ9NNI7_9PEZI|nr:hypothetical protein H2201_005951 [Coniosporium apollinis]
MPQPPFETLSPELRKEILGYCLITPSLEERFRTAEAPLYTSKQMCVDMEAVLWARYAYIKTELGDHEETSFDLVSTMLEDGIRNYLTRGFAWGELQQKLEKIQLLDLLIEQYNVRAFIIDKTSHEWLSSGRGRHHESKMSWDPIMVEVDGHLRGHRIERERRRAYGDYGIDEFWGVPYSSDFS